MANPNELKLARKSFENAKRILDGVKALPRRRGSKVVWSNGVTWTRVGDNKWDPSSSHNPDYKHAWPYSSAHVASGTIVEVIGS